MAGLFVLVACTDYVGQIDERIEEYETYEKARAESEIVTAEYYVEPSSVFFGELEDSRDGRKYTTVTIGSQTWMAENLNYETVDSYCYNDVDTNCTTYGRLYTWAAAIDSAGKWSEGGKGCGNGKFCAPIYPARGVCPEGWHLPGNGEWRTLERAVGGDWNKILSNEGWRDSYNEDGNVEDYGLRFLPSGAKMNGGKYFYEGSRTFFWTSTEVGKDYSDDFELHPENYGMISSEKTFGLSVRCVKNETDKKTIESSSSKKTASSSSEESGDGEESSSSIASNSSADPRETFVDERDGKVYKVTVIGKKRWMAENLNFETERSSCYNDSAANCDIYGRLYPWADAVDSAGVYSESGVGCGYGVECSLPSHVRGICPENWHLPTQKEWKALFDSVGNKASRLGTSTGYGFEALSAGYRMSDTTYYHLGSAVRFWSSEETTRKLAYYAGFDMDAMGISTVDKYYGFSIRCVQDDEVSGLISSSSMGVSSSSDASGTYLNSRVSYGEMKDARDGRVYKTVEIGGQTWMAENLNYGAEATVMWGMSDDSQFERYCLDDNPANCELYGGLYQWAEANDLPHRCNNESCADLVQSQRQGICPEGWHLPSNAEFELLIETLGGENVAGDKLKSAKGWYEGKGAVVGRNRNSSGFSALPAGISGNTTDCSSVGVCASFWSSTVGNAEESERHIAYALSLSDNDDYAGVSYLGKEYGASVRCVKGDVSSAMYSSSSSEEFSSIGTSSSCESSSSAEASSSSEGYSSSGSSSSGDSSSSADSSSESTSSYDSSSSFDELSSSSIHSSSSSNSSSSGNGE
ncbi:fibrobacter succinogenes major paralogous domain-containing protein [Fibrobacter sp.]